MTRIMLATLLTFAFVAIAQAANVTGLVRDGWKVVGMSVLPDGSTALTFQKDSALVMCHVHKPTTPESNSVSTKGCWNIH